MLHCLMDVVSCQRCKLPLGTWSSGCYLKFAKTCATKCCIRCKLHVLMSSIIFIRREKQAISPNFMVMLPGFYNGYQRHSSILIHFETAHSQRFLANRATSLCGLNLQNLSQLVLKSYYLNVSVLSTKVR